jgi:magnesium transporter
VVAVPEYWNVRNTLDSLQNPDLPKDYYDVIVVDAKYHPVGVIRLSRLLQAEKDDLVTAHMEKQFWPIPVEMDQEEVAALFRKYGLVTAPVVSKENRLIGIVTVDDVVEVIDEEAESDIMHLGGVSEQDTRSAAFETIRMRLPWLLVNLCTAFLSAFVISHFTATINQLVELAVLMSIVPSLSGNAGTQTLTVVVRGLATKEIEHKNIFKVIRKELLVGLSNGIFLALLTGTAAALWFQHVNLGITIAIAMIGNFCVAGTMGALIPMLLEKRNIDPAVGSVVVLTALTDSFGFLFFLGVSSLLLL